MSILESIRNDLLHIIESMYAITNIDITIVDINLNRIVATQFVKEKMGEKAPRNSAFHKCIMTGEQYFIENPRENPICSDCENVSQCLEFTELCIPIKFNNNIIGVLGMCAYNEKAQRNLILNRDSYINFEYQLSNMISTILNEKHTSELLEYRSSELNTLINSLNEGIMILDNDERIVTVNSYIKKNIDIKDKNISIKNLLSNNNYELLSKKNFNGEIGPIRIRSKEFVISSSPIYTNERKEGTVLVFSDLEKMKESVFSSTGSRDTISFDDIVGESNSFTKAKEQAIAIANTDIPVLLLGETGVGKDLFAKAIHYSSPRKSEIFMPVNCGAIPENLIESELFGYERGSFTGADHGGRAGKFEVSKDGSLFLDEIGEFPLNMQVKLNRVLEDKKIMRIGSHKEIDVNPRIIAATHRDLKSMVSANSFREDLYYRISLAPIYIPPLRERGSDIILLARYYLKKLSKLYNKDVEGFTHDCEKLLEKYPWPGNIRELKNIIEYALIFEKNSRIGIENIKGKLQVKDKNNSALKLAELTKEYERDLIKNRLMREEDSIEGKKRVAKELGISLTTLYRKLED